MHIAYSAFNNTHSKGNLPKTARHLNDRYAGYLAACKKHGQTIDAIQQYLPGWQPPFAIGSSR